MIEFYIMRFSPLVNPASAINDQRFLTNMANQKRRKTQDFFTKMPKVDCIYQLINEYFRLKAKL